MIHYLTPRGQDREIRDYLEHWGRALAPRFALRHYEGLLFADRLPAGTYILAALDQLDPALRALLRETTAQLAPSDAVRILNAPERTLLRYDLLTELHRRGLNRFRAIRAGDGWQEVRYPVFLREESRHWGSLTWLLHTPADLERGLRNLIARGHRTEDLLVVEFCDTADAEGLYRKYAAYAVGSTIIPRQLSRGPSWILKHRRSDFTRSLLREEQAYVLENPHEAALRRVFEIAGVQYGRIDYALLEGEIQTWEINLNPTIGRGRRPPSGVIPDELRPIRDATNAHFYQRFQAAFEAVDLEGGATEIPVRYSAGVLRRARVAVRHRERQARWAPLLKHLHPARRLVARLSARLRSPLSLLPLLPLLPL